MRGGPLFHLPDGGIQLLPHDTELGGIGFKSGFVQVGFQRQQKLRLPFGEGGFQPAELPAAEGGGQRLSGAEKCTLRFNQVLQIRTVHKRAHPF